MTNLNRNLSILKENNPNGDLFTMEISATNKYRSIIEKENMIEDTIDVEFKGSGWHSHPISNFEKCIMKKESYKKMPKPLRLFYRRQNDLIKELIEVEKYREHESESERNDLSSVDHCHRPKELKKDKYRRNDEILAKTVFSINLFLLVAKAVAAGLSGSLSIISSLMDSAIDIVSGTIMWWTASRMKKFNSYVYPEGRQRLEPISIIVLSVIMAVTSIQLIRESIVAIINMATSDKKAPTTDNVSICIISTTIGLKIILWIVCYKVGNSDTSSALTQDNRNDVVSNAVALVCSACSSRINVQNLKFLDPCGAILIAIYIMYGWIKTGYANVKTLTGYTASPFFMQKVTFIALNHHEHIKFIDTVRAFHFGTNFLVEVDIILDENMILKDAHDIGESLQKRLECLEEIERCFVHLDYEYDHDPKLEHKVM